MSERHTITAPDDPELQGISQLGDRSDLSVFYPEAQKQWSGEIMSPEEREAKRDAERAAITTSIRKEFLKIGLLAPMPLLLLALLVVIAYTFIDPDNSQTAYLILPLIILFMVFAIASFVSLKAVVRIFYNHALTSGLFISVLLTLLGLSVQSLLILSAPLHEYVVYKVIIAIGVGVFTLSTVLSFFLLRIWTARLRGTTKVAIIGIFAAALIGLSTFLTLA